MKREDLIKLIDDDDLGILNIKNISSSSMSSEERLVSSFLEINNFVKENNREPNSENGLLEHQLASRLKSIREDGDKIANLKAYDECNLLEVESKKVSSLKDIFEDDEYGVLEKTDDGIFQIRNISKKTISRETPEYVAHRKVCKDFGKFQGLFEDCQKKLKEGSLKLKNLEKHYEIHDGVYFVLGGILGLIVKSFGISLNNQSKINGRLYIVFENGTESNMLLQSLVKSMQENRGKIVIESSSSLSFEVSSEDKQLGYIYILKSLSSNPKIQSIGNLYKIGYSTIPVEERVKNASSEPAYLMAPVKIVTTYDCFNFNPQKLEQLLHNFFGSSCLNIDIFDNNNVRYMPREWFIAPLEVIERAVNMVVSGEIVNYRYNPESHEIEFR